MNNEKNTVDIAFGKLEELEELFKKTMIENNIPLWYFDLYLPRFYAINTLTQAIKMIEDIKKINKLQKLKKKYTRTIKKDNNHIYCKVRNYKKLHNKLEKMKG